MLKGKVFTPLDKNPAELDIVCKRILILLVPLATAAGKPIKISTGKVSSEPPPAKVLTTPAIKPAPTSNKRFQSNSMKAKIQFSK